MDTPSFERVAELRLLANIAVHQNLGAAAFKHYVKRIHEKHGTELSALARVIIHGLALELDSNGVATVLNRQADQQEAAWNELR